MQQHIIDAYICPSYIYGTYQALQQHNIDAYICPSYIYGTYVMLEVLLMYYYVLFSVYISGNYLIADIWGVCDRDDILDQHVINTSIKQTWTFLVYQYCYL